MRKSVRWILAAGAAIAAAFAPVPAFTQAQPATAPSHELTGFWLTTPHPELAIAPGKSETIPLTLRNLNLPPQRAELEVSGVPNDWKWSLKGGNREVGAVIVAPNATEEVKLELTPPAAATGKNAAIDVKARYGAETADLPLTVKLANAPEGELELKPELPALRGSARSTFSFKVEVTNNGGEEGMFSLTANAPEGFQTRFKHGYGSEEITGLPIKAGAKEDITLEVTPARAAPAGRYRIVMAVSGGGAKGTTELSIEVTGQPEVSLTGPQERLSGEAVAGKESSFPFTLSNTGSAPATDLELSSSPPTGWKVEFEPKTVGMLAPNATSQVNVRITPSEKAIAGDYMVPVRASGGSVSESAQFRVTVNTSTMWGAAGLGIIAAAVLVLGMSVMRYGRR